MKILIMGAGALGSVFGGFLSREHEVTLIGRSPHIEAIRRQGLRISGIWGDHIFTGLQAYTGTKGLPPQDLILITTKSYDTSEAVEDILHLLHAKSYVVSMQNGIGNEKTVAAAAGIERSLGGMAIFGTVLDKPGSVQVTVYASECKLGPLKGDAEQVYNIAQTFTKCGIPTLPTTDIVSEKWMKAFYNITLNPLSAILQVPYGVLGEIEETRGIMRLALEEAFSVSRAEKVKLNTSAEDYFQHLLSVQLPPTSQHQSSMLQDIRRGRKTEIDYLNGTVVKLGLEHDIPTPVNELLVNIVKALEKSSSSKSV